MERQLIPDPDQTRLRTSADLAADVAALRIRQGVPAAWRLDPSLTCFYNPTGMTAQQITDYEATASVAQLTADVTRALDTERLQSAVVWTIIDTYSAPATKAKYTAARQKILDAYQNRPWL